MTLGISGAIWLAIYILFLMLIAIYVRVKPPKAGSIFDKRQEFYLAASKPLGIPVLIFTFVATLFSAFFMVGMPGFIYTHGIGTWPWVIFGDALGMIGLFYFGRKFIQRRARFGTQLSPLEVFLPTSTAKVIFIGATTIFILPYLAVQISGFGRLLESATDGHIPFLVACGCGLAIIYIYSLIAGIKGIAFSDVFQGIILFGCAIAVGVHITYSQFNGPLDLFRSVYKVHPELLGGPGPQGLFTTGALISSCIFFAAIPISQPQFLTRYLLIKEEDSIRYLRGIAIGMGVVIAIPSLAVIPIGLGGALKYPGLGSGDELLGTILASDFASWFGGLFTVGVLAAAMSTADSILFSLGQMFSRDIYKGIISPKTAPTSELLAGRLFILFVAIIALLVGIGNVQLIVRLAGLSFAGTLQLVPAIAGGLWVTKAWKHSSSLSILAGVGCLFLFQTANPLASVGLNPAIAAVLVGALVYLGTMHIPNQE